MRFFLVGVLGVGALALGACKDDGCSDELKIALEVHVTAPATVTVDRVTAELETEQECGSFRDRITDERVWTCYEQGGGQYKVRVYSGDQEVTQETQRVEADECHITERETMYITLDAPQP
ncbi:MAG TPA: hypothetical protein VFZ61_23150 [Polyangiales bacterium]